MQPTPSVVRSIKFRGTDDWMRAALTNGGDRGLPPDEGRAALAPGRVPALARGRRRIALTCAVRQPGGGEPRSEGRRGCGPAGSAGAAQEVAEARGGRAGRNPSIVPYDGRDGWLGLTWRATLPGAGAREHAQDGGGGGGEADGVHLAPCVRCAT
eukprot:1420925-Rhodomonas_salina.2